MATVQAKNTSIYENPIYKEWQGPYGGVPAFDKVDIAKFPALLKAAMAEELKEIDQITSQKAEPNFENTIAALQRSGLAFDRVSTVYETWTGSMSTPKLQKIETEMAPLLAAHADKIAQNSKLFQRIEAVKNSPEYKKLNPEQQRLVLVLHNKFVLDGAKLSGKAKSKLAKINQELSKLSTKFSQNLLGDEEKDYLVISDKKELIGLPQFIVDGAIAEAKRLGKKGKWIVANTRSYIEPLLMYSPNRALRERAFKKWTSRGDNDNANNNNKLVSKILKLRAEKAKLLGFPSYAHWSLGETMAQTPEATMDLMLKVWKPAVAQARKDILEMQALVDAEKGGFKIAPWDYRYYAEKLRKAKFDVDFDLIKPYLRLENIRKAMFWVAEAVFHLKFELISGVPVFHSTMSVYKVSDLKGNFVGLWYFDPYSRQGKKSGAWMSAYREQSRMDGKEVNTLVSNNSNFVPSASGDTVISWDDAVTMFHEFGHAIHGLSSNVTYPYLSGTNVSRDYVEFPSQVYENWLLTNEVMKFLVDENGKQIPKELVKKLENSRYFNKAFDKVEFLASALVDMKLHLESKKEINPRKFEKETLKELGMPEEIVMRHRIPQFAHIFSSSYYAAGYYSYLWSQVLDKDAFEAFMETKNPFDQKVSKKLRDFVFSQGNVLDPREGYRKFRGRDPAPEALLRADGFL